jgi:hypothetical protein
MTKLYTVAEVSELVQTAHANGFAAGVDHVWKSWRVGEHTMNPAIFDQYLECEVKLAKSIAKDFDPMPHVTLPSHCPQCEQLVETAEVTVVPFEAQASHYHFKDGTRVICPTYCAPPKQCTICRIRWVSSPPNGKIVALRF